MSLFQLENGYGGAKINRAAGDAVVNDCDIEPNEEIILDYSPGVNRSYFDNMEILLQKHFYLISLLEWIFMFYIFVKIYNK